MTKNDPHQRINRRQMLLSVAGLGAGVLASSYPLAARAAADKPTLVTSIRSLSNPYHAVWKIGAEAFAKKIGMMTSRSSPKATARRAFPTSAP